MLRRVGCVVVLVGGSACAPEPEELPPLGEALVVVDTDAPVARLASRLRIDVYAEDTTWIDSRDLPMPRRDDWPGSFSVFIEEAAVERVAIVRLRAYPDGKERDYLGERFMARPESGDPFTIIAPPPGDGTPRLVQGGRDVTPLSEPRPALAIDRLLSIRLEHGNRGSVRVVLRAACAGTMADLTARTSCIDAENQRVALAEAELDADMSIPHDSTGEGALSAARPCTQAPRNDAGSPWHDGEVCVPSGLFLLGSDDVAVSTAADEPMLDPAKVTAGLNSIPERVAVMPPLLVDVHEVTVARWRRAIDIDGFVSPDSTPIINQQPLPMSITEVEPPSEMCTFSSMPLGREDYPLTCVSRGAARAFCQFYGGDLPSEAEWEHIATAAGRDTETPYPWGSGEPSCDTAVFGRVDQVTMVTVGSDECADRGFGPRPVAEEIDDRSLSGVVGLAGNVSELLVDNFLSFASICWATQPLSSPRCLTEPRLFDSARGAGWTDPSKSLRATLRIGKPNMLQGSPVVTPTTGFRCVRRGE